MPPNRAISARLLAGAVLVLALALPPTAAASLIQPDMEVRFGGVTIFDGDTTPSAADGTSFGTAQLVGDVVTHQFTIVNLGISELILTGSPAVTISGAAAFDFAVTGTPSSSIPPSGMTAFSIAFDPSQLGVRSAAVEIANNDPARNPYNFFIEGTAVAAEPSVAPLVALGLAGLLGAAGMRRTRRA